MGNRSDGRTVGRSDGRRQLGCCMMAAVLAASACRSERAAAPTPPGMDSIPIAGHVLYVPTGFHVNIFRQTSGGPRFMALAPDGSVYVTLTGQGDVVRLLDLDHDGVAESSAVFKTGLTGPHGIAFRGDTLYVAEENGVKRYDPGVVSPVQLVSNLPTNGGHSSRSIAFGPDNLMYVSIGSSCNICDETDSTRAAVMRYNLNGTGGRVFASGLRNSVGITFNPTTGPLRAANNDRDDIGGSNVAMTDSLPPERINILTLGGNYGWPQCYLPGKQNPEYPTANCSTVTAPAITFT